MTDEPDNETDPTTEAFEAATDVAIDKVRTVLDMSLDMTKDEKIRATALAMAVSYHKETIVKDGQLYQTMKANGANFRNSNPVQVIDAALVFEGYLRGEYNEFVAQIVLGVQHALDDIHHLERDEPFAPDSETQA